LPDGRLAGGVKYAGFLVRELHKDLPRKKNMAYIGTDEHTPIWLPESLPEEILAESFIELLNTEADIVAASEPEEPNFGFIVRDWFGPYLLSPPTRCLRGRC
jgi:hypothetical protein